MKYALLDQTRGGRLRRELPLLAEGLQTWLAPVSSDYGRDMCFARSILTLGEIADGEVPVYIQDDIDVKGAVAYHDVDKYGRQYVKVALNAVPAGNVLFDPEGKGNSLLGGIQHEGGESEGDRTANIWVQQPFLDRRTGRTFNLVAYENCDPVQEIADYMTLRDGTKVDRIAYVKPAWFESRRAKSELYDSHGALSEPLTLAPGGYQIAAMVSGEKEAFAEIVEHHVVGLSAHRAALKRLPGSRTSQRIASFNGR